MKNYTKIILAVFVTFAISAGVASAASLTVSPASLSKKIGDSFDVTVGVATGGSKVCVVEGTIALDKLSCSDISVADGFMVQTSPTCAKPTFSIGIPSCTMTDKTLFTVSVKATTAGTATFGFTGVDVVGEGVSLGTSASKGTYTVVGSEPIIVTPVTPKTTIEPVVTKPTAPVKKPAVVTETKVKEIAPVVAVPVVAKTEVAPTTNNFASAWMSTNGISLPWTIGIMIFAFLVGFVTAKKMGKK